MARFTVLITAILILSLINFAIWQKEQHLANGEVIVMELAPVDPRSLIQGDYMALNYVIGQDISRNLNFRQFQEDELTTSQEWQYQQMKPRDSFVVVALDDNHLARFVRLENGQPLAGNERKLQFRVRKHRIKFATNAFFFAEGQEPLYRDAKYGEFRVNENGEVLLTALLDERFNQLGSEPN